jgi:nucleoside-diphosphate-sugar epimerase
MRIATTGGTGFVGGHLAMTLSARGHDVVVLARGVDQRPLAREVRGLPGITIVPASANDEPALIRAFRDCDGVAHCAGINREIGSQN